MPSPNGVDDGGIQQFFGSWSNPSSINTTSVRFDHVIKDKLRLFFRFSNTTSSSATRFTGSPSVDQITGTTTRTYTWGATSLVSSRLSNDVRVNYSTNEVPQQFANVPFAGSSFVDMRQLSGVGAGGTVLFDWCCLSDNANMYQGSWAAFQKQWNLVDTVSLSVGRHQFKFGADYRRLTPHVTQQTPFVSYNFFGSSGADLDAAFTSNTPYLVGVSAASPAYPLYQNFSAFGEDEWKVTPRLTLSIGARQLAADGIVDLEKVGYIGFSRSCWYGMNMLTNATFRLRASLLADGIAEPYWIFLLAGGDPSAEMPMPFGESLQKLIKTSPEFNLDKIRTPVMLTSEAKSAAMEMWQPYASLRSLKKPVELVMINTDEHVITNPEERLASQDLSVDWFRFWLQGYEDPSAKKAEQYKRWRGLRELQADNDKKSNTPQAALR